MRGLQQLTMRFKQGKGNVTIGAGRAHASDLRPPRVRLEGCPHPQEVPADALQRSPVLQQGLVESQSEVMSLPFRVSTWRAWLDGGVDDEVSETGSNLLVILIPHERIDELLATAQVRSCPTDFTLSIGKTFCVGRPHSTPVCKG